ncbi:MAG: putative transcriptional regulator protein [Osedax symbiont Rs2]|nr:MAG: putative transcriptional regulator protein [Osedax symbiont Rs2]
MPVNIAILDYPQSLKSALYGLFEIFTMANRVAAEQQLDHRFKPQIIDIAEAGLPVTDRFDLILIPPSNDGDYYLSPTELLLDWLQLQHRCGAVVGAACAGTFILAASGLLKGKTVTTHWGLQAAFSQKYPELNLSIDKIVVNNGDLITAGGMLSWLDLALEVVAQFSQPSVMRQLGKILVVDTGLREQRYYQQFTPVFNHGDQTILTIQQSLANVLQQKISVSDLARQSCLTDRTFLRRFVQATKLKPVQYLHRLRIQKACDLLETTRHPFDWVANQVGFADAGACRKIFVRIMGLTPSEFRKRFK